MGEIRQKSTKFVVNLQNSQKVYVKSKDGNPGYQETELQRVTRATGMLPVLRRTVPFDLAKTLK